MPVDRSYHPSKAIREYQDRGMMKWQGFFLSEHTSAMKQWQEEENLPEFSDNLSMEKKFFLLSQSMMNRFGVILQIRNGKRLDEIQGTVKELISQKEVLIEVSENTYKRLFVENIITIEKADH